MIVWGLLIVILTSKTVYPQYWGAPPDLFIQDYNFIIKTSEEKFLFISGLVKNQGGTIADFSSDNGVFVYLSNDSSYSSDDVWLATFPVGDIMPADPNNGIPGTSEFSGSVTINDLSSIDPYYIILYVDKNNEINEVLEFNNTTCFIINDNTGKPDLVIKDLVAFIGGTERPEMRIICTIENQGSTIADFQSFNGLGVYVSIDSILDSDDILFGNINVDNLNPGETCSIDETISDAPTNGTYYVFFYIDYEDRVTESIESNNISVWVYRILLTPLFCDLGIQNTTINPISVYSGDSIIVNCLISNGGDFVAVFNHNAVEYYLSTNANWGLSDIFLGASTLSYLEAGDSYQISGKKLLIPSTVVTGTYYILFYVDKENDNYELIETNNLVSVPIDVIKSVAVNVDNTVGRIFKIFPNPNSGKFSIIDTNIDEFCSISVYNISGIKVYENEFLESFSPFSIKNIDMTFLPNGYYILQLKGKNQIFIGYIIITN